VLLPGPHMVSFAFGEHVILGSFARSEARLDADVIFDRNHGFSCVLAAWGQFLGWLYRDEM
jgi:hypothetical protein